MGEDDLYQVSGRVSRATRGGKWFLRASVIAKNVRRMVSDLLVGRVRWLTSEAVAEGDVCAAFDDLKNRLGSLCIARKS